MLHVALRAKISDMVALDTPGVRAFGLWDVDEEDLRELFPDLGELATGCRFQDCRHGPEPDCAVRAAVLRGELPGERLAAYRKLEAEAQAYALRQDVRQRRQSERARAGDHQESDHLLEGAAELATGEPIELAEFGAVERLARDVVSQMQADW